MKMSNLEKQELYIFVVWLDGNLETQRRLKIPAEV
jgi:hypothetical protein